MEKLKVVDFLEHPNDVDRSSSRGGPPHYVIDVQVNKRRQQVVGFGGALTDSASMTIMSLPEQVQKFAFDDYFGAKGLDYNMLRVPCSGTDMSTHIYSYDDLPDGQEDLELKHFRLAPEDLNYKIPFIKRANELRSKYHATGAQLKLMTSSWGPPLWMKTNGQVAQGYLRGDHRGPYYDAYARYLMKFLDEYEQHNITFWAMSAQNEPYTVKRVGIKFNSLNFSPEQLADFHEFNLIPALKKAGRTPEKLLLFLFEDNLNGHEPYTEALLNRSSIATFARGLARHWYIKDDMPYVELTIARLQYPPNYISASTEASFIGRPRPGAWNRGELYALDIMQTLLAGLGAWVDWNLALNMDGGPTWLCNYLDAAILVDNQRQIYYKNPMYYALGHISRFIRPNSHLLATRVLSYGRTEPVNATSFPQEEDGAEAVFQVSRTAKSTECGGRQATGRADKELPWYAQRLKNQRPLTVVAAELASEDPAESEVNQGDATKSLKRRFSLVVLNRATKRLRVELNLVECKAIELAKGNSSLIVELQARSITSFAFNC